MFLLDEEEYLNGIVLLLIRARVKRTTVSWSRIVFRSQTETMRSRRRSRKNIDVHHNWGSTVEYRRNGSSVEQDSTHEPAVFVDSSASEPVLPAHLQRWHKDAERDRVDQDPRSISFSTDLQMILFVSTDHLWHCPILSLLDECPQLTFDSTFCCDNFDLSSTENVSNLNCCRNVDNPDGLFCCRQIYSRVIHHHWKLSSRTFVFFFVFFKNPIV